MKIRDHLHAVLRRNSKRREESLRWLKEPNHCTGWFFLTDFGIRGGLGHADLHARAQARIYACTCVDKLIIRVLESSDACLEEDVYGIPVFNFRSQFETVLDDLRSCVARKREPAKVPMGAFMRQPW